MTEFLQRDFAHQNFFDLCIHEKQRLRQALNLLSNLLLTKIQLCWVVAQHNRFIQRTAKQQ